MDTSHNSRPVRRRSAMRRTLRWLGLATIVLVCTTITAASADARADRNQASAIAAAAGPIPTATASPTAPRCAATTPIRASATPTATASPTATKSAGTTRAPQGGLRPRRPERRRGGAPLPHRSAQARHRPRRPHRRRRDPPVPHAPARTGLRRRRVQRSGEDRASTDPRSRRSRPGFPARGHHRRPGRDVADGVHGPVDDLDAEHGDRREGDGMHPGDGAGSRDPQLEDLLRRRLAVVELRRRLRGTPLLLEDTEIDCQDTRGTGDRRGEHHRPPAEHPRLRERLQHQPERHRGGQLHPRPLQQRRSAHRRHPVRRRALRRTARSCRASVNVTIRHNTIYGMGADGSFGTSAIIDHSPAGNTNILIENNLLAGGAYTLYCGDRPRASTIGSSTTASAASSARRSGLRPLDRLRRRDPVRQRLPRNRAACHAAMTRSRQRAGGLPPPTPRHCMRVVADQRERLHR